MVHPLPFDVAQHIQEYTAAAVLRLEVSKPASLLQQDGLHPCRRLLPMVASDSVGLAYDSSSFTVIATTDDNQRPAGHTATR